VQVVFKIPLALLFARIKVLPARTFRQALLLHGFQYVRIGNGTGAGTKGFSAFVHQEPSWLARDVELYPRFPRGIPQHGGCLHLVP
jgi:hypothetical protein